MKWRKVIESQMRYCRCMEYHSGKKGEGATRVIYENPTRFNSRINRNEKIDKAREIIDELEADVVAYSEHRLSNRNGFSQMFRGREVEI